MMKLMGSSKTGPAVLAFIGCYLSVGNAFSSASRNVRSNYHFLSAGGSFDHTGLRLQIPPLCRLNAARDDIDNDESKSSGNNQEAGTVLSLQPAVTSSQKDTNNDLSSNSSIDGEETTKTSSTSDDAGSAWVPSSSATASMATMISRENKRILIEELGYSRREVDRLKFEIAPVLVEKRMKRPVDGIPEAWFRSALELAHEESARRMQERLENESKFPLKFPLLGISLVLFGKGLSDALITLIKVNIAFPGASLTDQFMGIPVLLIDFACILLGASLGWWTWNNMK